VVVPGPEICAESADRRKDSDRCNNMSLNRDDEKKLRQWDEIMTVRGRIRHYIAPLTHLPVRSNQYPITETHPDPYPSFPMDSDTDWSDTDSRIETSYVHKLPCDKIHQSSCHKSHLIPVEIFSEIFLYTVQVHPRSQRNLMLACRYWRDIMLSTPGIHSQLRIYGWTEKRDVEGFGRR